MLRLILIFTGIFILGFWLTRSLRLRVDRFTGFHQQRYDGYVLIEPLPHIVDQTYKSTLKSLGIGIAFLLVIVFLGVRARILLLFLPISMYLILQVVVLINHLQHSTRQRVWYNALTGEAILQKGKLRPIKINLLGNLQAVECIEDVQKNQGNLICYYKIKLTTGQDIRLSFLLEKDNPVFLKLMESISDRVKITRIKKLFPFI